MKGKIAVMIVIVFIVVVVMSMEKTYFHYIADGSSLHWQAELHLLVDKKKQKHETFVDFTYVEDEEVDRIKYEWIDPIAGYVSTTGKRLSNSRKEINLISERNADYYPDEYIRKSIEKRPLKIESLYNGKWHSEDIYFELQ
ncbi:hypothetical protein [Bacillus solimangrovi]|uniref:Uncharacterized protein n=1 Tax=Bacillus solimangrovi TaxID=1305675 RepID=A0A1E5LJF9_9BACI|nr:hypothetical protein [Bacillus solimangrovi]OEH94232.1 hypothetical protein BFG57_09285 [Bacillus solimangrovi]